MVRIIESLTNVVRIIESLTNVVRIIESLTNVVTSWNHRILTTMSVYII